MVEKLKAEHDVDVEWRPYLLRPDMPPEGMQFPAELRARYADTSERLKQRARAAGMEMVTSDHIPNSRRALEASEYAREQGRHEAFHQVVFRRFYGDGQDIGQWDVLRAAAQEVGLIPADMQRETESGKYSAEVDEHFAQAHGLGITGIPTYILDDKYAIVGAQPYEVFQQAMARLAAEFKDGANV